jgi:dTDP-4-amino-4,6-dideoxygalactose transaminase
MIPFNKPYATGKEIPYLNEVVVSSKISGNGVFTKKCQNYFEKKYNFKKTLLTTSCTDALEICAILLNIKEGDEIIMPSYTFVSTANAFMLRGAKVVFADSGLDNPNIDENKIEALITKKTKAIVVVHYAGVSCEMDTIMSIAEKHNLFVVEDAAQAIDSFYKNKPLGSIGHLATFSFHETKNIQCGEGGLLVINDEQFIERAEVVWEKGTNRSAFLKGEIDMYGWVDIGSSFLPSELNAAFLWAQLEALETIQKSRNNIWNTYNVKLKQLEMQGKVKLAKFANPSSNNGHMFYLICGSFEERSSLIKYLKKSDVSSVFHYLSLHNSPFFKGKHDGRELIESDRYTNTLLRLPLFFELSKYDQQKIIDKIFQFYKSI